MSNVGIPTKWVNTSNLMTFEWCFLIQSIMRIAIQCHSSMYYIIYLGTFSFAVRFNVFISFISLLWFLFIV